MSKDNYKRKFKKSDFLTTRIKESKCKLIIDLEEKAEKERKKLKKELSVLTDSQVEDIFLKYIPIKYTII